MSRVCPTCSSELPDDARFCPKDGTTVSTVSAGTPTVAGRKKEESDPFLGRVIDGRYRVKAKLGAGGVGAVYEGEHVEIKKPVAIKVLHGIFAATEEFRLRFEREARAASRLEHPSCVTVIDFGRIGRIEPMEGAVPLLGVPYLVMEFVRGKVLVDRLGEGRMPLREAVQVALGILAGLKHAHGLGIVHRDVKPANVMLVPDDGGARAKLLDFGLAKDLGGPSAAEEEPLTQAGTVFGTPSYLSPEQASGQKADARSDLYSVGVVLFEMVCGRRPFVHQDPLDTVRDHLETPPPPVRQFAAVSDELDAVIRRALAKDPAARFQSADEMTAQLAAVPELKAPSQNAAPSAAGPPLPKKALWGAGAALGAVLLFLALRPLFSTKPKPPPAAPPPPQQQPVTISREGLSHLQQAGDYQRKLWCSDAIEELERALRSDPILRKNPEVARVAIACLTPKTREKAVRFLVERIGADAEPALRQAAASDDNPEVRKGADRALARLSGSE